MVLKVAHVDCEHFRQKK